MSLPPPSTRQARLIWLALTGLAIAVLAGLAAGLVWGLGQVVQILSPVLWPLAIGGVVAYLLDPVVDFLQRKSISRPRAIILVFLVALLLVATFFASVVPQLVAETRQLAARVPAYADRLQKRLETWANHPPPLLKRLLDKENANARKSEAIGRTKSTTVCVTNDANEVPGTSTNSPTAKGGALD